MFGQVWRIGYVDGEWASDFSPSALTRCADSCAISGYFPRLRFPASCYTESE